MTAFFYRSLYLPHKGMFSELPAELSLGHVQVTSHLMPFTVLSSDLLKCQANSQAELWHLFAYKSGLGCSKVHQISLANLPNYMILPPSVRSLSEWPCRSACCVYMRLTSAQRVA